MTVLYGAPTARRRDAQRNRAAIVQAATEVMTSGGTAVLMPEIARRAGVGQATLYRHFPDRYALTDAVISHHLQRLESVAPTVAERPTMFRSLLQAVLHTQIAMRPLVLLAARLHPERRDRYQQRLISALTEPLRRAQEHGTVRPDLAPADLMLLLTMVRAVAEAADDAAAARAAADRSMDLVLDGIFR